ncbi:MgtC/SapB family protein [Ottowia sp.]|uniref:MgtC/SapB family protein n=1 Tax=Ottowia sp. TaxID=1898956 RepID=UPI002D0C1096|nr:MgtC/SapB family protein [Ottowia sp.]HOB65392.1 MgtC/SapB family protein [Ottowia sp.]HPZ56901.1 MgtC/SapB family protein [Ottowia sp.]HQD46523.1 MgtC/SapB family protein [Ottowia sp.]
MTDSLWTTLAGTVAAEFSDVPDLAEALRILLRLALALGLGLLLGYERESQGKSAGVRTHMLVAMGSALFVLLPSQMGMEVADLSRVVQGLMAGVGFLCAGTILKHSAGAGEEHVQGLTTAAGLWLTAAIGLACGLGREVTAIMSTLLALAVFALIPRLVHPGGQAPSAEAARDRGD